MSSTASISSGPKKVPEVKLENKLTELDIMELQEKSKKCDPIWNYVCEDLNWEFYTTKYAIQFDDENMLEIRTKRPQGLSKIDKGKMIDNFINIIPNGKYSSSRKIACFAPSFYGSVFWALYWAYVHEFSEYGIKETIDIFKKCAKKHKKNIKFNTNNNWTKEGIIKFTIF